MGIPVNLIAQLEQEEIQRLGKVIPPFGAGDTVSVRCYVIEGQNKRIQNYEGVVIATTHDGTLNDHSDIDQSWILEIAIPLANFRHLGGQIPPQDGDQWRAGLNRTKGYRGQFGLWSDTGTLKADFHRATQFGILTFSTTSVGP